jgi:biotin carboxylase
MAPAEGLPPATREALFNDAVRITAAAKYLCAGTVEFLVDAQGRHYFIEVRVKVAVLLVFLRGWLGVSVCLSVTGCCRLCSSRLKPQSQSHATSSIQTHTPTHSPLPKPTEPTHNNNATTKQVNPRVQVEHTVTEEVTGIDIVQSQVNHARIALHNTIQ